MCILYVRRIRNISNDRDEEGRDGREGGEVAMGEEAAVGFWQWGRIAKL